MVIVLWCLDQCARASFQQACNIAYTLIETNACLEEMRGDKIPVFLNTINVIGLKMETLSFKILFKFIHMYNFIHMYKFIHMYNYIVHIHNNYDKL